MGATGNTKDISKKKKTHLKEWKADTTKPGRKTGGFKRKRTVPQKKTVGRPDSRAGGALREKEKLKAQ